MFIPNGFYQLVCFVQLFPCCWDIHSVQHAWPPYAQNIDHALYSTFSTVLVTHFYILLTTCGVHEYSTIVWFQEQAPTVSTTLQKLLLMQLMFCLLLKPLWPSMNEVKFHYSSHNLYAYTCSSYMTQCNGGSTARDIVGSLQSVEWLAVLGGGCAVDTEVALSRIKDSGLSTSMVRPTMTIIVLILCHNHIFCSCLRCTGGITTLPLRSHW